MNITQDALPDSIEELKNIIVSINKDYQSQEKIISDYKLKIELLEEKLKILTQRFFAGKSEKHNPEQAELFNELEEQRQKESDDLETIKVEKTYNRRKKGRKKLPEILPREVIYHDIPDDQKECEGGHKRIKIREEISEKLHITPPEIKVIQYVRAVYACKDPACIKREEGGKVIVMAEMPKQIIPQGIATPGLLAYILISKYADALPFYRQEKIFMRLGVELPRATMCNWGMQVYKKCEPLFEIMLDDIRDGPLIGMDETPVQVLQEADKANTSKSYMWVMRGGPPGKVILVFNYARTRSGMIAVKLLKDFNGYLQTDGYKGYEVLSSSPEIILAGCWDHVRRKFWEAFKAGKNTKSSGEILKMIKELYLIEQQLKEKKADFAEIRKVRQLEAKPILEKIKTWLLKRVNKVPPKSLLGKAINYALNEWPKLIKYIEDGRIPISNILVENAIRPFAIGRKNWLFCGSPRGAFASAGLYSLIETAKANGLEPYWYLKYLFENLPNAESTDDYRALLPYMLDPAQAGIPKYVIPPKTCS